MKPQDATARSTNATDDARLEPVLEGLRERPRSVSAKWFYDAKGSALFDRITQLPEYYLTRTELGILERALPDIAARVGTGAHVVEPGSGSGRKTELLLAALERPAGYLAIDVSESALAAAARRTRARFPHLELRRVVGDFTEPMKAATVGHRGPPLLFFPGSTIGNFEPARAVTLLANFRALAGPRGRLLLGADLAKDPGILLPAYDDADGITAAFNRNMLAHLNRELGADFRPERFGHRVRFDRDESRIEMHLESLDVQRVTVAGERFTFERGERIHTENSYKHPVSRLIELAARAGWEELARWTDERSWFGVFLFG